MISIAINLPDLKFVKYHYGCRFHQSNKVFPKHDEPKTKQGRSEKRNAIHFSYYKNKKYRPFQLIFTFIYF